jgi:3',5'-cyclic AMP phosphodiesterase CpdA
MTRRLLPAAFLALAMFTTAFARRPAAAAPFFFIQMSDPQFGMYAEDSNFVQETANFTFAIATANRLHPAFVVITGDLINKAGDPAQAAEFHRIAKQLDPSIPLYNIPGNHDVKNTPTSATVAAYVKGFGPDHYVFHYGNFTGIVLNSTIIDSSVNVPNELAAQDQWLTAELARAQQSGARHIVVFQHHPWFLKSADEADDWSNIPRALRSRYLALFHQYGVEALFSGHYHNNAVAADGNIAAVTTGAVGRPFFGPPLESGFRIVTVTDSGITHQFYELGNMPNKVTLK